MHDRWWSYDDASNDTERLTVAADFDQVWSDIVLPFLDSSDDPRPVRDLLLAQRTLPLLEAASISRALNESEIRDLALDRYLAWLLSDEDVLDPRFHPNSLHRLVRWYAWVLPQLLADGRGLHGADRLRAINALQAAAQAAHTGEFQVGRADDAVAIVALGDHVGFDMTAVVEEGLRNFGPSTQ